MDELGLVGLHPLMKLSDGIPEVVVGLLDGPVDTAHPDLSRERIQELPSKIASSCTEDRSIACEHGTSVAGILSAKRGSSVPSVCPGCTLLVRPVFLECPRPPEQIPSTTFSELARAVVDCIHAGARIINISAAPERPSAAAGRELEEALDHACREGVLVVAAAGNQGTLGSSLITRHRWVITVGACDSQGRPLGYSNLGASIARNGLMAPGSDVTTLAPAGKTSTFSGTSAAVPFVTGTAALLWSLFPWAGANAIRLALLPPLARRRKTVVPMVLDAWAAYQILEPEHRRGFLPQQERAL